MVSTATDTSAGCSLITATRQYSLSPVGLISCFAVVAFVTLGIAVVFASLGAWLILPFAGLEALGLGLAVVWLTRHSGDGERIIIGPEQLTVECRDCDKVERFVCSRHWARVVLHYDRGGRCHVALRSHGRELELGRYVGDPERQRLARVLGEELGQH